VDSSALAAGVVNGLGHFAGYRSFDGPSAAANILPWGVLIGGEELHDNHHTFPTSAKLSVRWFEFDVGWLSIRLLRREPDNLASRQLAELSRLFERHRPLARLQAMRAELRAVWESTTASEQEALALLAGWCERAESSEMAPLLAFARRLHAYR